MSLRKNFFALLSGFKGRDFESRELERLPPKLGEFYFTHNTAHVPAFVYNLLVSKFIHLINKKPNYRNCGRLLLTPDHELQYNQNEIKAILQLYFNRDDADCSVLFVTGQGTPDGNVVLWTSDGDILIDFVTIAQIWDTRTTKGRNRELLIIVDAPFSGKWVFQNKSADIFVQSSCGPDHKSRDLAFGSDPPVGSVFMHNLLMANGQTDCFFEGAQQKPECSTVPPDVQDRVRNVFELEILRKSWDEIKGIFKDKFRSFSRDGVIFEGPPPIGPGGPLLEGRAAIPEGELRNSRTEVEKRAGFGGPGPLRGPGGPPFGGPFGGPPGGPGFGGPGGPPLGGPGPLRGPGGPIEGSFGGGRPIGEFGGVGFQGGFQTGGSNVSYSYSSTGRKF